MKMKHGDQLVSVFPISRDGKVVYKDVASGQIYKWDELTPAPHETSVSSLTDHVSAVSVGVRIGVTATQVMKGDV